MKHDVRPKDDRMAEELALLGHDIRSAILDVLAGLSVIDSSPLAGPDRLQLDRAKVTAETLARYLEEGLTTLLAEAPPNPEPAPTDTARLLADLKRRWCYAQDSSNALTINAVDLPPMVHCNRTAVDRILSNLISNALTHSGGQAIQLDVTHAAPDQLLFTLTDQGPGFPSHITPLPQTNLARTMAIPAWKRREGHGLGLGIAQTLAQRIGANLVLENLPGGGGVARLCVPISLLPGQNAGRAFDIKYLVDKKVLIADDSMPQLLLLTQFLRDCGAQITMARDGKTAEEAMASGDFDLALLDLEMPGRTGLEVCQAFRNRPAPTGKATRIIILTAHSLPMIQQNAIAAGADKVLVKPITSSRSLAKALCSDLATKSPKPTAAPENNTAQFTRLLDMAGPELAAELLARYEEDLTIVQTKLTAALAEFDWHNLRSASHVLIALAGTAGMGQLEQSTRRFNLAANDNRRDAIVAQKDAMLDGLTDLLCWVRQIAQERRN
jgi:CheY-like chemotaxis protein